MDERTKALASILARCDDGQLSPAVALMEMLIETEDDDALDPLLRESSSPSARSILALRAANAGGCARVAAMLRSGADSPPKNATVEDGVSFCRRLFDWSVSQSEEASVALYSLGSAALLAAATAEIVVDFGARGLLGAEKRALDVGCGIGRMEEALAPRLRAIVGIDVSSKMLGAARRRVSGVDNVTFLPCSGLDLVPFDDRSFDFVFAVDSFPYVVQAGLPLAETYFAEVARVLRPGGDFAILQFSYRGDPARDRDDARALAARSGFDVIACGETPFSLWNGTVFHLRLGRSPASDVPRT